MKHQLRSSILKSLLKNNDDPLLAWNQDIHVVGNTYLNFSSRHTKYIIDQLGDKNESLDIVIPYYVVKEFFKKLGRKKPEFITIEHIEDNQWQLSCDDIIEVFCVYHDRQFVAKEKLLMKLIKEDEYKDVDNYFFSIPAMTVILDSLKPFNIQKKTYFSSSKSYSMEIDQHIDPKSNIMRSVFDNGEIYVLQLISV